MKLKIGLALAGAACVAVLALGLCAVGWSQESGPVIHVMANISPSMTIELSDDVINFSADRGPNIYDADRTIEVRVAANYGSWTLSCSASPLVSPAGQIPPDRIFVSDNNTLSSPDEGAGPTYANMGVQRLVAEGGPQPLGLVNTMRFRLKTEWTDRPGTYNGTISFTYLATP